MSSHMPKTREDFKRKILDMEEFWQFPCCWAAIDGCHIPMKCPPGACKDYYNFKKILFTCFDGNGRFTLNDAVIFRMTQLYFDLLTFGAAFKMVLSHQLEKLKGILISLPLWWETLHSLCEHG